MENALSLASTNILSNPYIQSNVKLRNNVQNSLKSRPRLTKDNISISTLRKRHFNHPPSTSPLDNINHRFYRNKLERSNKTEIDLTGEKENASPVVNTKAPTTASAALSTPTTKNTTPLLIRNTRKKVNKKLWHDRKKMTPGESFSLRKVQRRLNAKNDELCTALMDLEDSFESSQDPVDYCKDYVS